MIAGLFVCEIVHLDLLIALVKDSAAQPSTDNDISSTKLELSDKMRHGLSLGDSNVSIPLTQ